MPVTPTSPKANAVDAGWPAHEGKQPVKSAAAKPSVDTLETKQEASGALSCLQDLAYSVWSCMTGFFQWIGSFFGPAARDNPELLANPLKQIAPGLEAWKNPKGPMKQLLDELAKCSKDKTVKLSAKITASEKVSSHSHQSFLYLHSEEPNPEISLLGDPENRQLLTDCLIRELLRDAESQLKTDKLYIDLNRDDRASIEIIASLATPVEQATVSSYGPSFKINRISVYQEFEKDSPDSEPRLSTYLYTVREQPKE